MEATSSPFDPASFLLNIMASRQHVAPKRLIEPGPQDEELEKIFSAASHAPDHGLLKPWRFILIPKDKRSSLGDAFVSALKDRDPKAKQDEIESAYSKAFRSPCLMLCVINNKDSQTSIPPFERIVSLGCAIQNMLLMSQALGIGSGITSGRAMNSVQIRELFLLADDEQGICFLNFGKVTSYKAKRQRPLPSGFISSI